MTLMRALVARGSRLVYTADAHVVGVVARPADVYRWLRNDGIKNLGVRTDGKASTKKKAEP